jgi:class 3 adenylate cyclase/tetratricopeptide (TPR) repeat protein
MTLKQLRISVFALAFLFSYVGQTFGNNNRSVYARAKENSLISDVNKASNDSVKVIALQKLAYFYYDVLNNSGLSDSVCDKAISMAEKYGSKTLRVLALTSYVSCIDPDQYYEKTLKYVKKAVDIAVELKRPDLIFSSKAALASVFLSLNNANYLEALKISQALLVLAIQNRQDKWLVDGYLNLGQSYEGLKLKVEALKCFLNALDLAEKLNDKELLSKCYARLSSFYVFNTLFDKAIKYKKLQFDLLKTSRPIDSLTYMWMVYDTMALSFNKSKMSSVHYSDIRKLLDFSIRTGNNRMKSYILAFYRTYLIESGQIALLKHLYTSEYPQEFNDIAKKDPGLYFRMKAFFTEDAGMIDTAVKYFRDAEQIINRSNNFFLQSNFQYRLGQFYQRHHNIKKAIEAYTKAYTLASRASMKSSIPFMLAPIKPLEKLLLESGDCQRAYYYAEIFNSLIETRFDIEKKERVIQLDLNNTQQKRDLENLKEKQRIEQLARKRRYERNYLAGVIAIICFVSVIIYLSYRNQKRSNKLLDIEKKKSDDLLLNILPSETAEELKKTGAAKAKKFEQVTVMFTDFKDFTKICEHMEAEDLVRKIHYYFSEFDLIISKFNLEKIKIIGDSYMCAGGIPIPNQTNPADVVSAALEIQQFMIQDKEKCIENKEPFFELRVGIHTGPVVAGIVGLRKFAYDIWGDTVNTASRMESSGEINKVNISGTTYDLVKNSFSCFYRGRISVKNKGEIEMYFVTSQKTQLSNAE